MKKPLWSEQPPPIRRPREGSPYDWPVIIAALKDRPGQWLLVNEEARMSILQIIKRDSISWLRDDEWDFHAKTRNNNREVGSCELWMVAEKKPKPGGPR